MTFRELFREGGHCVHGVAPGAHCGYCARGSSTHDSFGVVWEESKNIRVPVQTHAPHPQEEQQQENTQKPQE